MRILQGTMPVLGTVLLAWGIVLAQGLGPRPAGKQVGTPTRQVAMFSTLERQLLEAQEDKTLLDAMLTEDFQEWSAEQPGGAIDRTMAMQRVQSAPAMQGAFRDMNVRMEGEVAIVSFVFLHREGRQPGATFVVDVWRKHGEAYELATRYVAPMRMPAMDRRPTGKE